MKEGKAESGKYRQKKKSETRSQGEGRSQISSEGDG